jgi:hypothetical protein
MDHHHSLIEDASLDGVFGAGTGSMDASSSSPATMPIGAQPGAPLGLLPGIPAGAVNMNSATFGTPSHHLHHVPASVAKINNVGGTGPGTPGGSNSNDGRPGTPVGNEKSAKKASVS